MAPGLFTGLERIFVIDFTIPTLDGRQDTQAAMVLEMVLQATVFDVNL